MSETAHPPLWLLPNVLAVDAPVVAAVWQRFLGATYRAPVPLAATAALVLIVWAVYLFDRFLDARRGDLGSDRHRWAAKFPRAFAGAALAAIAAAAVAGTQLPSAYVLSGLVVAAGVGTYLAAVHLAPSSLLRPGVKELLVGLLFAAGAAIALNAAGLPRTVWLPSVAAFGGICWLNCRLIDHWERRKHSAADTALGVAVIASALALPSAVGMAVGGAGMGLLAVHLTSRHRPRVARVLADVVLLTPLVPMCVGV